MKTPQIFLDLDGVMADFELHFVEEFGIAPDSVSDDKMWEMINGVENYFLNMPLTNGAIEFFDWIKKFNPIILTACPRSNYQEAAIQKRQWVRKNLCDEIMVLPMTGGKNKFLFMQQEGDILIDDFEKNCIPWNVNGGHAIQHFNFEMTKQRLLEMLEDV